MSNFAQRIRDAGLAKASPIRGCTEEDIRRLESRYDIKLPTSYRDILTQVGHCAGNLCDGSSDLLYPAVYERTAKERASLDAINHDTRDLEDRRFFVRVNKVLRRFGFPVDVSEVPDYVHYSFPDDGLIIYADDSLPFFWMIRCIDPQDSPVYTFDYEGWSIELRREYDSVLAFFETLLAEAVAQNHDRQISNR